MRGLGFILLIVAIQVIAAIIQQRKKTQEKKAREEMNRRRAAQQLGVPPGQASDATATPMPVSAPAADLEARRRAQLEQLRQRRAGRKGSEASIRQAQLRAGSPLPSQSPRRGREPIVVAPTIGVSDEARIQAVEAAKRAREAERARLREQARIAAEIHEAESSAAHARYEKAFHAVAGEPAATAHAQTSLTAPSAAVAAALAKPGTPDRAGVVTAALTQRLRQPQTLRELIVLREIIDRPVSLRE